MIRRTLTRLIGALRTSSWRSWAVAVLLVVSIAANGLEHGHIYSRSVPEGDGDRHALFEEVGLHTIDTAQEGAYYALAFMAAPNPLAVVGASMLARPLFQIPINLAAGKPALWAPDVYTLRVGGEVVLRAPVPPDVLTERRDPANRNRHRRGAGGRLPRLRRRPLPAHAPAV